MFQKNNINPSIICARGCKKLQKFAEICRKNTTVCKILQKIAEKCATFHNFFPSAALLIENLLPFNLPILPKRLQLIRPLAAE